MEDQSRNKDRLIGQTGNTPEPYDYAYVHSIARIALYDDLLSAPHITEIAPAPTVDYIVSLASAVYEQAKKSGGSIPYTVIQEVSENFIHAQFSEVIVSILDKGNTIRFADQGPGIKNKNKAQLPGFTSAIEPMKRFIRGVGSGLPIVKEYLNFSHGTITIDDNLNAGSVVTISLQPDTVQKEPPCQMPANTTQAPLINAAPLPQAVPLPNTAAQYPQGYVYPFDQAPFTARNAAYQPRAITPVISPLSQRERDFLSILLSKGALGVTDLVKLTGVPQSSTYVALTKLEQAGLIKKTTEQKKRILTDLGYQVALSL